MAKNRNKKKRNADSMDISEVTVSDTPQAMDMSESGAQNTASGASIK
uniref:Uncharacterized protein n=1 Tax=Fagus sylvatica TaxID=28930 RepID=A0A2N9I875_FAGSY